MLTNYIRLIINAAVTFRITWRYFSLFQAIVCDASHTKYHATQLIFDSGHPTAASRNQDSKTLQNLAQRRCQLGLSG
jgi:hypothetical protein